MKVIDMELLKNRAIQRVINPPESLFFTVGLVVEDENNTFKMVSNRCLGFELPHAEVVMPTRHEGVCLTLFT